MNSTLRFISFKIQDSRFKISFHEFDPLLYLTVTDAFFDTIFFGYNCHGVSRRYDFNTNGTFDLRGRGALLELGLGLRLENKMRIFVLALYIKAAPNTNFPTPEPRSYSTECLFNLF